MPPNVPARFPADEPNPYAPPRSDLEPELAPLGLEPGEFSIGDVLSRTWAIYRERMGICVGVVVGCNAINQAGGVGFRLAVGISPLARNPALIQAIALLGAVLLGVWTSIGQTMVMLEIARGQNASFGDIFRGGRMILPVIAGYFVLWLALVAVVSFGALPGLMIGAALGDDSSAGPIAVTLGIAAGVIAGVILVLRYSQYSYLIIDRSAGVAEAFSDSMKITRGKAGLLFVTYVLAFLIGCSGILACVVGLIFTIPFTMLMLAVTYLELTGEPMAGPNAKRDPLPELDPDQRYM